MTDIFESSLYPPRPENKDLFARLYFREEQLDAVRKIYKRYFEPLAPQDYNGSSISVHWYKGFKYKSGENFDRGHSIRGFNIYEAALDKLWNENFSDILPYMNPNGNISIIPPGEIMYPHVDRLWRPCAIYFPIKGCSEECVSEFYHLPNRTTENSQTIQDDTIEPIAWYSVNTHAYLQNVHAWHGVKNKSSITRIAFGWNTSSYPQRPFVELVSIFKDLGYIKDE